VVYLSREPAGLDFGGIRAKTRERPDPNPPPTAACPAASAATGASVQQAVQFIFGQQHDDKRLAEFFRQGTKFIIILAGRGAPGRNKACHLKSLWLRDDPPSLHFGRQGVESQAAMRSWISYQQFSIKTGTLVDLWKPLTQSPRCVTTLPRSGGARDMMRGKALNGKPGRFLFIIIFVFEGKWA